jgi:uncharacterized membrane protein required for colicin V production
LRRGVIRVLISIIGFHFTLLVIGYVYQYTGRALAGGLGLDRVQTDNFSYVVFLIFLTIVVEVTSRSLFEYTRILSLRGLDNLLGGLLGILYGALWASLFLVPIQYDASPVQYGVIRGTSVWREALSESTLVPILNQVFQTVVLNIVGILFIDGTPELYLNEVSRRVSYLMLSLTALGCPLC